MSNNKIILEELNKLKEELNNEAFFVTVEDGNKIISKYSPRLEQLISNCSLPDIRKKYFLDNFSENILLVDHEDSLDDIYKNVDKLKQTIDLFIKELQLKDKIKDSEDLENRQTYGQLKKEIEILKYFKNGDKTKTQYQNDHNQEFDNVLFDLLFRKKYLSFRDINLKYSELETGKKYSFRSGVNDIKVIMTTSEGENYLHHVYTTFINGNLFPKMSDIVGAYNNTFKYTNKIDNLFKTLNAGTKVLDNISKISSDIQVTKTKTILDAAFLPINKNMELYKSIYPKDEFIKFKEIIVSPNTIENIAKKKNIVENTVFKSELEINLRGYELLFNIESKMREKIYLHYNLNEDNEFKTYSQFSGKLGQVEIIKDSSIIKVNKLDLIKERRSKEDNKVYLINKNYRLIDYFDLEELIKFIDDSIFKNINKEDKDYLRLIVKDFANVRKKIAHSRLISEDELNTYKKLYNILLKLEENSNDSS